MNFSRSKWAIEVRTANIESFAITGASTNHSIWWNGAIAGWNPSYIAVAQYLVLMFGYLLSIIGNISHLFAGHHLGR